MKAIVDFFKGLGCIILGIIGLILLIGIGILVYFIGPIILAGAFGFFILLSIFAILFGR